MFEVIPSVDTVSVLRPETYITLWFTANFGTDPREVVLVRCVDCCLSSCDFFLFLFVRVARLFRRWFWFCRVVAGCGSGGESGFGWYMYSCTGKEDCCLFIAFCGL